MLMSDVCAVCSGSAHIFSLMQRWLPTAPLLCYSIALHIRRHAAFLRPFLLSRQMVQSQSCFSLC